MAEHPRALKSGLIPCANCGHRLPESASFCPECSYLWPRARDTNRVICATCRQSLSLYRREPQARTNTWTRLTHCPQCGDPAPWRGQSIEAQEEPPPSLEDRLTAIAILVAVGTIVSLILG